jgi:hypothetical protein
MTWRPVPGYEHLYEVSSTGKVRSARRKGAAGGEVAPDLSGRVRNYLRVRLWDGSRRRSFHVHQLVAMAFHGPAPTAEHVVCHKNDDGFDNRVENLYWGTREENDCDRAVNAMDLAAMEEAPF